MSFSEDLQRLIDSAQETQWELAVAKRNTEVVDAMREQIFRSAKINDKDKTVDLELKIEVRFSTEEWYGNPHAQRYKTQMLFNSILAEWVERYARERARG